MAGLLSDTAIIWGVTCLLIVAAIVGAHVALSARYGGVRVFDHYSRLTGFQKAAYAGWKPAELNDMLSWTWSPGWIYEPWVGFREKPRGSGYVNVSADGVRLTTAGARDLSGFSPESLFVFGGSTMFGYGVADHETVASHLQALVGPRRRVFNLGRAFYYTAQENMLFESLLRAGYAPSTAVFVDGLNERCDIDVYQRELGVLFARAQGDYDWRLADAIFPLVFAARKVARLLGVQEPAGFGADLHRLDCVRHGRHSPLKDVVRENLLRRERLCAEYRVQCVSFLQPIAGLHGSHPDLAQHPEAARKALRGKFDHLADTFRAQGLVDASGALDSLAGPAYVDGLHYSSAAGREIATRIAAELDRRGQAGRGAAAKR